MPASLEEKATQCLVDANLTLPQLADRMGLSAPKLTVLCCHGDPRLSQLEQLATCPRPNFLELIIQSVAFNQAGIGNTFKLKISRGAAHQLAAQFAIGCTAASRVAILAAVFSEHPPALSLTTPAKPVQEPKQARWGRAGERGERVP